MDSIEFRYVVLSKDTAVLCLFVCDGCVTYDNSQRLGLSILLWSVIAFSNFFFGTYILVVAYVSVILLTKLYNIFSSNYVLPFSLSI